MSDQPREFYAPPVPVTKTEYTIKVEHLEGILRPQESQILGKKYQPKVVNLRDGSRMIVRQAQREEADMLLQGIRPYLDAKEDFYDLVAYRTFSEILAWKEHRIKDHYALIGVIDGKLVGIVNARLWNNEVAISLHTISFKRGVDVGPGLYFAKAEHAIENLGVKEWWATFESYVGLRVLGMEWASKEKPWPEFQHELGGSRVFYVTREDWQNFVTPKFARYKGERPVSSRELESTKTPKINSKAFEF